MARRIYSGKILLNSIVFNSAGVKLSVGLADFDITADLDEDEIQKFEELIFQFIKPHIETKIQELHNSMVKIDPDSTRRIKKSSDDEDYDEEDLPL